ncbi:RNA polymerase sigma factor [Qipengyuania qiaonensis]|uniref:RNA polymerase sigma factor n=1 Tax=Qipengyuania qiaonensis TaxID=2867240 RepID=A0ABS7J8T1_9SPHN|nr:RNA polymerase sigma factor [Qipengyuania qiaonensis]MBX7483348.1 RNA polymerase sigma factor [Qipengyuania qiaonensis]
MSWLRPIDQWFADQVFVYRAKHRAYALRLTRDGDEAEDLVQEAYARLFRLSNWAEIANPNAFTLRIIHNEAVERFRKAQVVQLDRSLSLQALEPVDEQPLPDRVAIARQDLNRMAGYLERLPPRCREAVCLRKIDNLSPREVAAKMDISVSTLEKHLSKGLRLLAKWRYADGSDTEETRVTESVGECRKMRKQGMK